MKLSDGRSLARFINRQSSRFQAAMFRFGEECWVLVIDCEKEGGNGEPFAFLPISDFDTYLDFAKSKRSGFPTEYVDTLISWQYLAKKKAMAQTRVMLR